MIHARADYNRIQDPAGLIPSHEPVFLLRAQDASAPDVVEDWARRNFPKIGSRDAARLAMDHAVRMRDWQREHGSKVADLPTDGSGDRVAVDPAAALAERFHGIGASLAWRFGQTLPAWADCPEETRAWLTEVWSCVLRGEW